MIYVETMTYFKLTYMFSKSSTSLSATLTLNPDVGRGGQNKKDNDFKNCPEETFISFVA